MHWLRRNLRRRSGRLALLAVVCAGAATFAITTASATHDGGLFQLDRNATDGGAGDDWATPPKPTGSADLFTGILEDNATAEQFTGGGSKDDEDISQWLWKAGEPLDKDNITNAYAAGYVIPEGEDVDGNKPGDFVVYFGLDRLANNGSAQVGFWFFKGDVSQSNTKSGAGFKFNGAHQVGDVLVQSNFSQGGEISNISVFKWVGSGGSHGELNQEFSAADCVGPPPLGGEDPACATVNRETVDAPWTYSAKFPDPANAGGFPKGSFFEGGLNISRLVPDAGCFATFMAETRSSTPFDSRLFDFTLGEFNTCQATTSTQSSTNSTTVVPGTSVTDTATVTGTSLTGGSAPTPTGTVKFFLCQPDDVTAAGCPAGSGSQVGDPVQLTSGVAESEATSNTNAIGRYCWRAEYTPAEGSPYSANSHTNADTECFTTEAQPTTTTTRQFVYPQDKARITGPSGGDLEGSVKFELFDSLTKCQAANPPPADVKYTRTVDIEGASPQTAATANSTYAITDGTTHYWKVSYTSTNPAQQNSVSNCVENTDVTFDGDDGTITFP